MSFYSPISLRTPAHTLSHSFQSQTSTSDYFTQPTNTTATLGDPQARLLERWKNLESCMNNGQMSWKAVITLDRKLDEVESVLRAPRPEQDGDRMTKHELGLGIEKELKPQQPLEMLGEVTPPASEALGRLSSPVVEDRTPSSDSALLIRVAQAVEQLRQRQQEFKHLHNVAIAKIEKGAQHISTLTTERDQLQKDVVDDEAELTYLKLKLRIIEIQTLPYVPKDDRDGLALGIERWKLDWADVDERYRKRRWKRKKVTGRDEQSSVAGEGVSGENIL